MFEKLRSSFRSSLITGVLVLAPIGAVLWLIAGLFELFAGGLRTLSGALPYRLHPRVLLGLRDPLAVRSVDLLLTLLLIVLIVAFVSAVGLVSRNYVGRRLLDGVRRLFSRVPVVSTVYSTLEQLMKTFSGGNSRNFRRVVLVEYPRPGLYALAFVTSERDNDPMTGKPARFLNIYVPTTPNPTSGFYLTVPADQVREARMSVEEALKEIISLGIVHRDSVHG